MIRFLSAAALLAIALPAHAAEKRCGWLDNPTPGNFWLTDRTGQWTIAEQGGYQAPGMDNMPDMSTRGWVETNGPHGYGCACMTVTTNRKTRQVTRVFSATPRPVRQCRADRRLPKP
jgi:Protein of unknown function (DUF4087)